MQRLGTTLLLLTLAVPAPQISAQSAPPNFVDEFMGQFEASAEKMVALAEAMPADKYAWQPDEGVMSIVLVYMHIANYNYMYPDQMLGIAADSYAAPGADTDYSTWETAVTEKQQAVQILSQSMDHVREVVRNMTAADLEEPAVLYGRDVAKWAVLLQLVTHMNEHVGQSIAYARMNGIVPPWAM